ncbi:MAG TPA: hypothetical protein VGC14_00855 [Rhizobium sp.]
MDSRDHGQVECADAIAGGRRKTPLRWPGIVHIGVGAFHRAHQAAYTGDALNRDLGDW